MTVVGGIAGPVRGACVLSYCRAARRWNAYLVELGCDLDHLLHAKRCGKWDGAMIKRRGSIMPSIFDLLYREYCRARLAEMRKQLLVSTASHEVPEANCEVSHPGGSVGRDSDFGDDRTATQREARQIH